MIAASVAALGFRRVSAVESSDDTRRNPLQLFDALRMATLFQIVLMAVHLANRVWGESGILTTAALLGLTDVDALTMSMARGMSGAPLELAARAIVIGVAANTALKLVLALVFSTASFRALRAERWLAMLCAIVAWLAV